MTVDTASMRTGHLSYSLASPATVPRSSLHSPPSKNHLALPMATITLHFGHCTCICLPCAQNRRISSHNLSEFGRKLPKRASKRRSTHGKSRSAVPAPLRHSQATTNSLVLRSRRCSESRPRSKDGVGMTTGGALSLRAKMARLAFQPPMLPSAESNCGFERRSLESEGRRNGQRLLLRPTPRRSARSARRLQLLAQRLVRANGGPRRAKRPYKLSGLSSQLSSPNPRSSSSFLPRALRQERR